MFVETKEAGEVQVEQRKLKLSEAIRIGARLRPQNQGQLFKNGASCAMGAAIEGRGGKLISIFDPLPHLLLPELFLDTQLYTELGWKVANRNDAGESRESIADWLESQGY